MLSHSQITGVDWIAVAGGSKEQTNPIPLDGLFLLRGVAVCRCVFSRGRAVFSMHLNSVCELGVFANDRVLSFGQVYGPTPPPLGAMSAMDKRLSRVYILVRGWVDVCVIPPAQQFYVLLLPPTHPHPKQSR